MSSGLRPFLSFYQQSFRGFKGAQSYLALLGYKQACYTSIGLFSFPTNASFLPFHPRQYRLKTKGSVVELSRLRCLAVKQVLCRLPEVFASHLGKLPESPDLLGV